MAVQQVACSFQNDGNYSQLDLRDQALDGPLMRIEVFRCSQPSGAFGTTGAGSTVQAIAAIDHLANDSNHVFRSLFSVSRGKAMEALLETREVLSEDGSFEVRVRDVDTNSETYGSVILFFATPRPNNDYEVVYEVRCPHADSLDRVTIPSPLVVPVNALNGTVPDIGDDVASFDDPSKYEKRGSLRQIVHWPTGGIKHDTLFNELTRSLNDGEFKTWAANVKTYERFGDFRDKCIHPGTNLTGSNVQLASEYLLVRAYRASLVALGRAFDQDMIPLPTALSQEAEPLSRDPKPGVYSPFLNAYILDNEIYQLGLDNVHSDYGGIPMGLAPGSRLETGITPIFDATRANRSIAELAFAFYVRQPLPAANILASIADFEQ